MARRKKTQKEKQGMKALLHWRWLLAVALLVLGLWAHQHVSHVAPQLKLAAWLLGLPVLIALVYPTAPVVALRERLDLMTGEMRKVSWPDKDEVVRFTMMVGVVVLFFGVILWLLDAFFVWALSLSV